MGFDVPVEIGRGLAEVDSLRALLQWLEGQSGYAADILRMHALYQLIDVIRSQSPDSAYMLAKQLEELAQKSGYPAARGLSDLARALTYSGRAAYDSVILISRQAMFHLEKAAHEKLRAQAFHPLSRGYRYQGAYDSALVYYEQAGAIRESGVLI